MNRWNDWFEQGKRDFERANIDIEYEYYEWACFSLQQASEKVLKALAMKSGLTIWGHSLTEILNILAGRIDIPDNITSSAKLLDIYYIPTRYPNGFASGKPADYFTKKQAMEAHDAADSIIRFCASMLGKQ
ncbi:MAG TPA: HEPN domain-containing protein [Spirochaetota bacterium]|nr:HEPN domain-containing protein [Spirochaetota bacterium]